MRQYFKTCKVHSCFSQDMNEPLPSKCRCRKLISREFATKLVVDGIADWLIKFPENQPCYDVVLKGRAGKTPRAHTIESAHMERYTERMTDDGSQAQDMDDLAGGNAEVIALYDAYHDTEIESRLKLFRGVGTELVALKKFSDSCGDVKGEAGRVLTDKIINQADTMKKGVALDDPFSGHAIFSSIGGDQRTCIGKYVAPGEEKLDKRYDSW